MMRGMEINVSPVKKFTLGDSSNVGQRWGKWNKSFNINITASGLTVDGQKSFVVAPSRPEGAGYF